jgi:dihydropyrimidinase
VTSGARFDLIVQGGQIVSGDCVFTGDIGIAEGRILGIAERLEDAPKVIAAQGRLILPGGVDAHCHMGQPSYGGVACADDFRSGTLSAACGGTTTVIPFAMAQPSDRLAETVASYRARAHGQALIDFAIHPTIQAVTAEMLEQDLPNLIRQGYASVKIFTTYAGFQLHDQAILEVMKVAAREGALVMIHAENDGIIEVSRQDLLRRGLHAPIYHAKSRPPAAEQEAIYRMICFADLTGAEILIVHVSCREGLEEIGRAQAQGKRVHAETCPHYLLLSQAHLDQKVAEAAKYICSPPLRGNADQTALWNGMTRGLVEIYSSDHSPCRLEGPEGKLRHGPDARFDQIANGLPGLELRLPLLFSEGLLTGRLSLNQFASLTATAPARLHGIAPQKGAIAIGADADLVIWDPERETVVGSHLLHDNVGFSPYEGMRLRGWPVTTISRGDIVVDDGRILAAPGRGLFVPCYCRKQS